MNTGDVAVILERVALRCRTEGPAALKTTLEWSSTIRAASYGEDQGGNRWVNCGANNEPGCDDCPHPLPQDPTGEAAIDPDETAQLHRRLLKHLRALTKAAADVEHIFDQATPDPDKRPRLSDEEFNAKDDRWCTSCEQDRGRQEPIAVHSDGRVRYEGLCVWCHDFIKAYGRRPTAALVRKHHTPYVNVTQADVLRALGLKKDPTQPNT